MTFKYDDLEARAKAKEDENWAFRRFMKMQDRMSEEEVDQLVFEISERWKPKIDCAGCRNCCKVYDITIYSNEVDRLAGALGLTAAEFQEQFLEPAQTDHGPGWQVREKPCPFLQENRCRLEKNKPIECRDFPYLDKPEVISRLMGMIERTFTCPWAFEVMEEFKREFGFRKKR